MARRRYPTLAAFFAESGRSQKEVAERLHLSPSYVSMLAAGLRTPSLRMGERLAALTGVPTAGLIGLPQKPVRSRTSKRR